MFETTKIFCAIDTASLDHACDLARVIAPVTGGIKLGLEFFNAFGPQGVEKVLNAAPDAQLFLDMKYHCLLYTSPSPRDQRGSRMPSSA